MNRALPLALWVALSAASAHAQEGGDPARLFPREAPVDLESANGLARLSIPAEVLGAARPDLSDVRIHRADGTEVPYLVDSGVRPRARDTLYEVMPRSVTRSLQWDTVGGSVSTEQFELLPPASAEPGERWTLHLSTSAPDFVRAITVRAADGRVIAQGSIFRLPAPVRERLLVELPALAAGEAVRVELSGQGAHLEPVFRFVATLEPEAPARLEIPLEVRARRTAGGRTVVELARPVGITPDLLRVTSTAAHFARPVRVLDVAAGQAGREVGSEILFRVRELDAEDLELALGPATGELLRVEVDDGDAGALEGLAFVAIVRQPSLVFDATAERGLTLRYGGGRARAPRYDLVALLGSSLGTALVERPHAAASLGPLRDNPAFDAGPALAFAMRPGRVPELARYPHEASLEVRGAREGASRVRLPPAVQALARDDLADVRVVDAEGRQWPYLVLPGPVADTVEAVLEAPSARERSTAYTLRPPDGRARVERVRLDTDAPFVARSYTLYSLGADGARVLLTSGLLRREPDDLRPLEIPLPADEPVDGLELVVEDGNDAPLSMRDVRLDVVSPTFFLVAPDGTYRILVGDRAATAPAYELSRAAPLVLAVVAVDATVGAPRANPAFVRPPWYGAADGQSLLLWAVLLLAVLVLGLLTLRLAHRAPEPAPAAPDPAPPSAPPTDSGSAPAAGAPPGAPPADPPVEGAAPGEPAGDAPEASAPEASAPEASAPEASPAPPRPDQPPEGSPGA